MVGIPTKNQTKLLASHFPLTLNAGSRNGARIGSIILANFFKEMKMSKLRVRGTLVTLILFIAVAVFPDVVQALGSKQPNCQTAICGVRSTGVLIADGGDPWPPPRPVPLPNQPA